MAFNGSGTFNRLYTWVVDAANGIKIRADRMDAEMDGFATGLTDCVTRDGQSPWLANIPAGGFIITGLGNGVQATDSANLDQVQSSKAAFAVATGTAQVIAAAFTPTFVTLTDGMQLNVRALLANTAAAPTFAPNAIPAHPITKIGGAALAAGDIAGPLHEMILRYNLANTRWELLNPSGLNSSYMNVTSNTAPAVGIYRPAANTLGFATNGGLQGAINASGVFFIGAAPVFAGTHSVAINAGGVFSFAAANNDAVNPAGIVAYHPNVAGVGGDFYEGFDTILRFKVQGNGDVKNVNNVYGAISDKKYKNVLGKASSQWDDVKTLASLLRKFTLKDDKTKLVQMGLIAQDVRKTNPGLVEAHPDFDFVEAEEVVLDDDGEEQIVKVLHRRALDTESLSVKYSIINLKILGALGEALARIEQLEKK